MPDDADYTLTSGASEFPFLTGVSIGGGVFFTALSSVNEDPFYPADDGVYDSANLEEVDSCLAHPQAADHLYHYHIMPPCIGEPSLADTMSMCTSGDTCYDDVKDYALDAYSSWKSLNPIGIARDGHIIWGPYDDNGDTWSACDVDVCNGLVVDGEYGYVATTFHPYLPICYGPGTVTNIS